MPVRMITVHRDMFVLGCAGKVCVSLPLCLSVCNAFSQISLCGLCRRLLARLTSTTKFVYFENWYDESSSRGPVALHACTTRCTVLLSIDTLIFLLYEPTVVLPLDPTVRMR
jgi:hypothetical protein